MAICRHRHRHYDLLYLNAGRFQIYILVIKIYDLFICSYIFLDDDQYKNVWYYL